MGPSAIDSRPRFERGIVSVQLRPDLPVYLRVAEKLRPPLSKRIDAGANPAAEIISVVAGSSFPNGLENRGAMTNRNGATPSTTANFFLV